MLCFSQISSWVHKLKSILYKSSYRRDLVDKCIKEILDKILSPKSVASTVPTKDLVIAKLIAKLSLQIHTNIDRIMKNKFRHCNAWFVFQTKCKLVTFLHSKTEFHHFYVLALFRNFNVVAAMLLIMTKLNVILRSECVNT